MVARSVFAGPTNGTLMSIAPNAPQAAQRAFQQGFYGVRPQRPAQPSQPAQQGIYGPGLNQPTRLPTNKQASVYRPAPAAQPIAPNDAQAPVRRIADPSPGQSVNTVAPAPGDAAVQDALLAGPQPIANPGYGVPAQPPATPPDHQQGALGALVNTMRAQGMNEQQIESSPQFRELKRRTQLQKTELEQAAFNQGYASVRPGLVGSGA